MAKINQPGAQPAPPQMAPQFPAAPQQPQPQAPTQAPQQAFPGMPGAPPPMASQPYYPAGQPAAEVQRSAQPQMAPAPYQAPQPFPQPGYAPDYNPTGQAAPTGWPQQPPQQQNGYAPQPFPAGPPMGVQPAPGLSSMMPGGGGGMDLVALAGAIDFTQIATGGGGRLLPIMDALGGQQHYEGRITKATFGPAKSGNPMVSLELVYTYPPEAVGVRQFENVPITENTMWKFKALNESCELLSPDGRTFVGQGVQDYLDNIVAFYIVHEDDLNGNPRNKVANGFMPATKTPGLAPAPAPAAVPNFGPK